MSAVETQAIPEALEVIGYRLTTYGDLVSRTGPAMVATYDEMRASASDSVSAFSDLLSRIQSGIEDAAERRDRYLRTADDHRRLAAQEGVGEATARAYLRVVTNRTADAAEAQAEAAELFTLAAQVGTTRDQYQALYTVLAIFDGGLDELANRGPWVINGGDAVAHFAQYLSEADLTGARDITTIPSDGIERGYYVANPDEDVMARFDDVAYVGDGGSGGLSDLDRRLRVKQLRDFVTAVQLHSLEHPPVPNEFETRAGSPTPPPPAPSTTTTTTTPSPLVTTPPWQTQPVPAGSLFPLVDPFEPWSPPTTMGPPVPMTPLQELLSGG